MKNNMTRNSRGSLAEFGPALVLFFVFLVVPMLSLARLGMSTAAIYFIVDRAADKASKAPSYDAAMSRANEAVDDLINSPIARFSGLKADGVGQVCLYVDEHVTMSDTANVISRDQLLRKPIYPEVNTYEYEVQSSYSLEPLLPACGLPWLGKIPFLCAPVTLTVRAVRPVEYPDGLRSYAPNNANRSMQEERS